MTRPLRLMCLCAALAVLLPVACAEQQPIIVMTPSLAPVDMSRPIVRYQPIEGSSCASMRAAVWEMKRLVGVDGYVEVSVELKGGCWVATGYPFTYGSKPKTIAVRGRAPMPAAARGAAVPGEVREAEAPAASERTASTRSNRSTRSRRSSRPARSEPAPRRSEPVAPARTLDRRTCEPVCRAFGKHAGATALIQRVVADRCISRCVTGDQSYFDCANRARDVSDVKRCNAN